MILAFVVAVVLGQVQEPISIRYMPKEARSLVSAVDTLVDHAPISKGSVRAPNLVSRLIMSFLEADPARRTRLTSADGKGMICFVLEAVATVMNMLDGVYRTHGGTPPISLTDTYARSVMKWSQLHNDHCGGPGGQVGAQEFVSVSSVFTMMIRSSLAPQTAFEQPVPIPRMTAPDGSDYTPTLLAMLLDLDSRLDKAGMKPSAAGRACEWASAAKAAAEGIGRFRANSPSVDEALTTFGSAEKLYCVGAAAAEKERAWKWLAADKTRTRPLNVPIRPPHLTGVVAEPKEVAIWVLAGVAFWFPEVVVVGVGAAAH